MNILRTLTDLPKHSPITCAMSGAVALFCLTGAAPHSATVVTICIDGDLIIRTS